MGLDRYDSQYLDSVNASRQLEGLGETALQLVLQGSMVLLVWQQTPSGECLKEIFPRDPATFAGECFNFGIRSSKNSATTSKIRILLVVAEFLQKPEQEYKFSNSKFSDN